MTDSFERLIKDFSKKGEDAQSSILELKELFEKTCSALRQKLIAKTSENTISDSNNYFSNWMENYFELEKIMYNNLKMTPPAAKLGKQLEITVRCLIYAFMKKNKEDEFLKNNSNFYISTEQVPYGTGKPTGGGRMEIGVLNKSKNKKIYIQVKRGFGSGAWEKIKKEREIIQNHGDHYLLLSPTEYTNKESREEILKADWVFIWKTHCWKGDEHKLGKTIPNWADSFLEKTSIFWKLDY